MTPKSAPPRVLSCLLLTVLAAASGTAQAGDSLAGEPLYRMHCAHCHGQDGRPVMPTAPDFTRPAILLKPDLTLLARIRAGKGAMPAYQGQLRDRQILDIVAHLRTLR